MNDRFKFRVWNKQTKKYMKNMVVDKDGTLYFRGAMFPQDPAEYIVEQCTGLKDKNGNLIYEGDVLKYGEHTGHIFWKEDTGAWGITAFLFNRKPSELEIVGNIHEQKDVA